MGNWEKMTDYEAEHLEEYKARFTLNFKKIYMDVDELDERTMEVNEKHPKDDLTKLWGGAICGMFILFIFCYHALALAMIPFLVFYIIAIIRIGKCWKGFGYSSGQYVLMNIGGIVAAFMLGMVVQYFAVKLIFPS